VKKHVEDVNMVKGHFGSRVLEGRGGEGRGANFIALSKLSLY